MLYNDLLTKLTYLTKRNNLSNTEIGNVLNIERRAINGRAERNSKFKDFEIEKIEKFFNIDLSTISILENSLERYFDNSIDDKIDNLGDRLLMLKEKNNLSNLKMAALLDISESELIDIIRGKTPPDWRVIKNLKQNFKVSIDWLLFGE